MATVADEILRAAAWMALAAALMLSPVACAKDAGGSSCGGSGLSDGLVGSAPSITGQGGTLPMVQGDGGLLPFLPEGEWTLGVVEEEHYIGHVSVLISHCSFSCTSLPANIALTNCLSTDFRLTLRTLSS